MLTCDEVTSNDPTTDPQDIEIDDEYPEPCVDLINTEQHRMISLALGNWGVVHCEVSVLVLEASAA